MSSYRYTYADSSGNNYQITGLTITFEPIKEVKNADGFYTNGEPVSIGITQQQLDELTALFDLAFRNRTFRVEKRTFESSEIRKIPTNENSEEDIKKVVLAMRSPDKQRIESLLKQHLN